MDPVAQRIRILQEQQRMAEIEAKRRAEMLGSLISLGTPRHYTPTINTHMAGHPRRGALVPGNTAPLVVPQPNFNPAWLDTYMQTHRNSALYELEQSKKKK